VHILAAGADKDGVADLPGPTRLAQTSAAATAGNFETYFDRALHRHMSSLSL
jgi:hypothetical protein